MTARWCSICRGDAESNDDLIKCPGCLRLQVEVPPHTDTLHAHEPNLSVCLCLAVCNFNDKICGFYDHYFW